MTYYKMTTISGYKAGYRGPLKRPFSEADRIAFDAHHDEHSVVQVRSGHWKPANADRLARRAGCVGDVEVVHSTADMSGKGYGGYDHAYIVGEDGTVRERPLSASERDYDDADAVAEVEEELGF